MILTAKTGTNADLIPEIFSLYVPEGSEVADVTYGKGVFWQKIDKSKYITYFSDLQDGTDFRKLPHPDKSMNCVILDPPYMHGGKTIKKSLNDCYKNANEGHSSVVRLYAGGILEAARVLRKRGVLIVKTQDEIESGKQHFTHVEILELLELFGFKVVDLFVLMQSGIPLLREPNQKSARKNHSYAIVAELRG